VDPNCISNTNYSEKCNGNTKYALKVSKILNKLHVIYTKYVRLSGHRAVYRCVPIDWKRSLERPCQTWLYYTADDDLCQLSASLTTSQNWSLTGHCEGH